MTKALKISTRIPFPGFYGSWYEDALDREAEQYCEWTADDNNDRDDDEQRQPPELRLNAGELSEALYWAYDGSEPRDMIARWYVEGFGQLYAEYFGYDLTPVFEEMTSPREYNFETDRLFALIPLKTVRQMFRDSKAEGHATLSAVIEDRHTSRSDFMSFYKTDLPTWTAKPLRDWDHNEVETLLRATAVRVMREGTSYDLTRMSGEGGDPLESDVFRNELYDRVMDGDGAYQAWEKGVDWAKYEERREDARQAKLDALAEEDPEAWERLTGGEDGNTSPSFRCVLTSDLFNQQHAGA